MYEDVLDFIDAIKRYKGDIFSFEILNSWPSRDKGDFVAKLLKVLTRKNLKALKLEGFQLSGDCCIAIGNWIKSSKNLVTLYLNPSGLHLSVDCLLSILGGSKGKLKSLSLQKVTVNHEIVDILKGVLPLLEYFAIASSYIPENELNGVVESLSSALATCDNLGSLWIGQDDFSAVFAPSFRTNIRKLSLLREL